MALTDQEMLDVGPHTWRRYRVLNSPLFLQRSTKQTSKC